MPSDNTQTNPHAWMHAYAKAGGSSNSALVADLSAHHITDMTREAALRALAKLVIQPPVVQFLAHIGDCAWSRYLKTSEKRYSSMHTLLKFVQRNPVCQAIFLAYEQFPDIRPVIEQLHESGEDNRVPYLHVFVKSQRAALKRSDDIATPDGVAALLRAPEFTARLAKIMQDRTGKHVGGATNTHVGMYDWVASADAAIRPDFDAIAGARYRADLGGGFATPDVSRVLRAPFVSHDINDPAKADESLIFVGDRAPPGFDRAAYVRDLHERPWVNFDVFESKFPTGQGPYAVVSFGFLSSTVTSQSGAAENPKNTFATLLAALNTVLDLVVAGEDVYCYWYSRASRRLHQNAIIQLRFKDHRLVDHKICACYFSDFERFHATAATVKRAHLFQGG